LAEKNASILFIINDSPYGSERPYNAMRLALNLANHPDTLMRIFLVGDGVNCALSGQNTPKGYYNVERMIHSLAKRGEVFT